MQRLPLHWYPANQKEIKTTTPWTKRNDCCRQRFFRCSRYEGILPAADGPGIQYVLSVDSVGPNGESGYTLVTTYLDAEGQGKNTSFTSKGKRQVIQKDVNNNKKTAYKLTPTTVTLPCTSWL